MTTREDNIKKINAELEMLSDDELDNIAGGSFYEKAGDTRFLNDLAGLCDRFGDTKALFDFFTGDKVEKAATAGWAKLGIKFTASSNVSSNHYFFNDGTEITRQQAFDYACAKYGKKLQDMPGGYNF